MCVYERDRERGDDLRAYIICTRYMANNKVTVLNVRSMIFKIKGHHGKVIYLNT